MFNRKTIVPFLNVLFVLLIGYLATLQTIPNGAEHYYMIDVGETQIVLNTWGTLHSTGYPVYVMLGNVLVTLMKVVGISAAAAPGLVSMIWSLLALVLIYVLMVHITDHPELAAVIVMTFGLTRTVWIHSAIAEIYSFGLLILAGLLLLALWKRPIRGRVYWLALLGGIGVFHHRALIMAAPALIYAVWEEIFSRQSPENAKAAPATPTAHRIAHTFKLLMLSLLIGLLGFLPYLYLPIRAQAGAHWVYGEPATWDGFWDQFLGREASRFIGTPQSGEALLVNFNLINSVLVTDLTAPGVVLGLIGLVLAVRNPSRRKAAITLLLSAGVAYAFHVLVYTDILSALILPITLSLAFGWLFLIEALLAVGQKPIAKGWKWTARYAPVVGFFILGVFLLGSNLFFIRDLTTNTTGLETIRIAEGAPPGSTLMIDWGPRHFAVGFARDVLGELPDITLVSHKTDFKAITGELVTPDFTFYNRPVGWWQEQLGTPVYLRAAAPDLVEIATQPEQAANPPETGIEAQNVMVKCKADAINLSVDWVTATVPDHDLSVFVHLLDANGAVIGQGDQAAPVYGWRPLTTWGVGEVVHDIYILPNAPDANSIEYGLYRTLPDGSFENEYVYEIAVECG